MGMRRAEARRLSDHAVDVLYAAAAGTLDVVVIVPGPGLVAGAGRGQQVDPADQVLPGQVLEDLMHRL
ncbi:MAG TPA: hypothetical protein VFG62_22570 [Rhodopila sp.]|nr:hypothetical protein [Rhodopila sp.]